MQLASFHSQLEVVLTAFSRGQHDCTIASQTFQLLQHRSPDYFSPAGETLHLPCYYVRQLFPEHCRWLTDTSLSCASEAYSLVSSQFRFYQQHRAPPAHRPSASAARLPQLGALSYEPRVQTPTLAQGSCLQSERCVTLVKGCVFSPPTRVTEDNRVTLLFSVSEDSYFSFFLSLMSFPSI